MTKKVLPLFVLITLAACLLSYKFGSAPVALATAGPTMQETSDSSVPLTLPPPPAEWVVHATSFNGPAASATRLAGGAGVQHVVDCISATITASNAGSIVTLELLDGSTNQLLQWGLPVASSSGPPSQISMCGLNIVGSPNQAMTLAFQGSGPWESVELIGHDAT